MPPARSSSKPRRGAATAAADGASPKPAPATPAASAAPAEHEPSALDVARPAEAPATQSETFGPVELFDQRVSSYIYALEVPLVVEYLIACPALAFSIYSVPALLISSLLLVPLRLGATLFCGAIALLIATNTIKIVTRRLRPGAHVLGKRRFPVSIRSIEKTNAFPSGDSAQGAFWCTVLALWHGRPELLVIPPLVQFGRVFFGCHWVSAGGRSAACSLVPSSAAGRLGDTGLPARPVAGRPATAVHSD